MLDIFIQLDFFRQLIQVSIKQKVTEKATEKALDFLKKKLK